MKGSISYSIAPETIAQAQKDLKLTGVDAVAREFLSRIHFICQAPQASLDIQPPQTLENEMLTLARQLGIGTFPNNKQNPETFILKLTDELTNKRSSDVYQVLISELLQKLGVVTDFGSIM